MPIGIGADKEGYKEENLEPNLAELEYDFTMPKYNFYSLNVYGDEFNHAYSFVPNAPNGGFISLETQYSCIGEEVNELQNALNTILSLDTFADHEAKLRADEAALKEMCDVIVTLNVFARAKGWDLDGALEAVHESNLLKFNGATFREDGKLLKGPNYIKPDLAKFI